MVLGELVCREGWFGGLFIAPSEGLWGGYTSAKQKFRPHGYRS
jgi:hypothetical protein